ncbi:MAG: VWA domain-containing protein [Planctomycetota bacterium]
MRIALATAVLTALLASAAGAEPELFELLSPDHPAFYLRPVGWAEFRRLPTDEQRMRKIVDIARWRTPNFEVSARTLPPGADEQTRSWYRAHVLWLKRIESVSHAGFLYEDRRARKRRSFGTLVRESPGALLTGLTRQRKLMEREWARFDGALFDLIGEYRARIAPGASQLLFRSPRRDQGILKDHPKLIQHTLAVRHSEQEFLAHVARSVGELLTGATWSNAKPFVDELSEGLASKQIQHRLFCADLLGWTGHRRAQKALENAMKKERRAHALAEMVLMRGRQVAGRLKALRPYAQHRHWNVRSAAIRALARDPDPETLAFLKSRAPIEEGRLREEVVLAVGARPANESSVSFYDIPAATKRVLFCIDVSPSMLFPMDGLGGTKEARFKKTRRELSRALSALPEDVRFNIVTYNAQVMEWKPRMVPATEKSRNEARAYIQSLTFRGGGTNTYGALRRCIDMAKTSTRDAAPRADTIFFLTDGEPTSGILTDPGLILTEITERNRGRHVVIHSIGLSEEQNAGFLQNLAEWNGGHFVAVR